MAVGKRGAIIIGWAVVFLVGAAVLAWALRPPPLKPFAEVVAVGKVETIHHHKEDQWDIVIPVTVIKYFSCSQVREMGKIWRANQRDTYSEPPIAEFYRKDVERITDPATYHLQLKYRLNGPLVPGVAYNLSFQADCWKCQKIPDGVESCRRKGALVELPSVPFTATCDLCDSVIPSVIPDAEVGE